MFKESSTIKEQLFLLLSSTTLPKPKLEKKKKRFPKLDLIV